MAELASPATPRARWRSLTPLDNAYGSFSSLAGKNKPDAGNNVEPGPTGCRRARAAAVNKGSVALVSAIQQNDLEALEFHSHHGEGNVSLATAIQQRDLEALEFLLQKKKNHVDINFRGARPLHLALRAIVSKDDKGFRMVELLLKHGADPNLHMGDAQMELAPLHGAVLVGDVALASLLLGSRADANGVDVHGSTALHTLCQQRLAIGGAAARQQAVDLLLRHGANPLELDSSGCTAEELAFDPQLQALLRRASRWYTYAGTAAVCRHVDGIRDAMKSGNPFLAYPEFQKHLTEFVSGAELPWTRDCTIWSILGLPSNAQGTW